VTRTNGKKTQHKIYCTKKFEILHGRSFLSLRLEIDESISLTTLVSLWIGTNVNSLKNHINLSVHHLRRRAFVYLETWTPRNGICFIYVYYWSNVIRFSFLFSNSNFSYFTNFIFLPFNEYWIIFWKILVILSSKKCVYEFSTKDRKMLGKKSSYSSNDKRLIIVYSLLTIHFRK